MSRAMTVNSSELHIALSPCSTRMLRLDVCFILQCYHWLRRDWFNSCVSFFWHCQDDNVGNSAAAAAGAGGRRRRVPEPTPRQSGRHDRRKFRSHRSRRIDSFRRCCPLSRDEIISLYSSCLVWSACLNLNFILICIDFLFRQFAFL